MDDWHPDSISDLKIAHKIMMTGLVDNPGDFRKRGVGIQREEEIIHLAPPVENVSDLTPQDTPPVTSYVKQLLDYLRKGSSSLTEIITALELSDRKNLMSSRINPALEAGLIERTIPDKPRSKNQKYRLTDTGIRCF